MRRNHINRTATKLHLLIGLAAATALPGCAAPAIGMASHLLTPNQQTQLGLPSTDMLASLAQRMGIALPGQHDAALPANPVAVDPYPGVTVVRADAPAPAGSTAANVTQ